VQYCIALQYALDYSYYIGSTKRPHTEDKKMSKYEPRISEYKDGSCYALIVRIDRDGQENVIHGYARHFKSMAAAQKSAASYIAKHFN
jgi:hypothetical protein